MSRGINKKKKGEIEEIHFYSRGGGEFAAGREKANDLHGEESLTLRERGVREGSQGEEGVLRWRALNMGGM